MMIKYLLVEGGLGDEESSDPPLVVGYLEVLSNTFSNILFFLTSDFSTSSKRLLAKSNSRNCCCTKLFLAVINLLSEATSIFASSSS